MPVYIALLRGINVGGNKRIKMGELRELYAALDIPGAQTLLQSGNVVFHSELTDRAALVARLEAAIEERFGFHVAIVLRARDELDRTIAGNPSGPEAADPAKLAVMFLTDAPAAEAVRALAAAHAGPETFHVVGTEAYLYYPEGMGRSKLTNALIERKLGVTGTARNWNTIMKLRDLAAGVEES